MHKIGKLALSLLMAAGAVIPSASSAVLAEEESGESTTVVVNNGQMGLVSIKLSEYEYDENGDEIPYIDNKLVAPGDKITKIARITNEAEKCWIRARLIWDSEVITDLSDDMAVIADGWIKRGEYYYYTKPLENGEAMDFLKAINIPNYWGNEYENQLFHCTVQADAVQYVHFTPDFDSEDPWFGTPIEVSIYDSYGKQTTDDLFQVVYKGGSQGLVRVGDDFFSHWGILMPGDVLTDTVELKNEFEYPITMYFSIEKLVDDKLAKAIRIEIKDGDKVIFEGSLADALNEVEIAYLKKGESKTLTYTLTVPAELQNEYALLKTKTKWIFRCKIHYPDNPNPGGKNTGIGGSLPLKYLGIGFLASAVYVVTRRKEKEEGEDDKA